jgi:glycosyltransferase involved in cell wall biosynthesis
MIRPCVLIPIYNHKNTIALVLDQLEPFHLPCIIVNDGSDAATCAELGRESARHTWVHVIHHAHNAGKGTALRTGFRHAEAAGYSHAVVIDADGQHRTQDVARFLAAATAHPPALIIGKPIFGPDVPSIRYYGRKLSQGCVWAETLSWAIGDPLCGFRAYPLATTMALINRKKMGSHMDFEPEIAVRLYWADVLIQNIETKVCYPEGGLSHFRLFRDNVRMVWMHTRLLCGMVGHLPRLLRRKCLLSY